MVMVVVSKVSDFGYLREGGRLEVDFRVRVEGLSLGVVGVRDGGGGEGDVIWGFGGDDGLGF